MRVVRLTAAVILAVGGVACVRSPTVPSPRSPDPVVGPLPIPPPPPVPILSATRFLAFGDSMTEGTVSPALQKVLTAGLAVSYPYKLQERLTATYADQTIVVLNAGRGGELATDGVKRLPDAMREAQPNVLLLMEGVNDLNNNAGISSTIGGLASMVTYARSQGVQVFLATLPPQRRGGSRAYSVDLVPRFNDEVRKTAVAQGVTLVDVNSALDLALIGQDGLHPTEAGYSRLAEIFFEAIRSTFEQSSDNVRTLENVRTR